MSWIDMEVLVAEHPPTEKEVGQIYDYLRRRAKARFYADENLPISAVNHLRGMGAQVRTAQEAGMTGHPDENHAAYALKNSFVLLTCDRDFLDERRFPLIHCPAIFVFDFGPGSRQDMRLAFRCLNRVFRFPQFFDKWWKVDAKRDCWTELVLHLDGTVSRSRHRMWRGKMQEWVGSRETPSRLRKSTVGLD